MANRVDPAVAKQRQQKIILIVGAVLLVGLLAIQGPKLMKQLKGSKSAASSSSSSTATTPDSSTSDSTTPTTPATPTTPTTGTTSPAVASATGPSAQVAGVVIRTAGAPSAGTGQLFSFSRFKAKDPFVPRVKVPTGASASGGSGTTATGSGATTASGGSSGAGAVATPSTASPAVFAYATLMVNGKPQQLQLKQLFPKNLPTFVLVGVSKGVVKISVAGGKFTGGGVVKLELGKPVTVMNTTTGQRFVMKLVYTGVQPEQIAGFKQPAPSATQPGTTTTQGTTTTTTTTSTSY